MPVDRSTGRLFLPPDWCVWHVPGCSRAWRREYPDGAYVLVSDIDAYDLPESGGPYAAYFFSARDALIEAIPFFREPRRLVAWLRHVERLRTRTITPREAALAAVAGE